MKNFMFATLDDSEVAKVVEYLSKEAVVKKGVGLITQGDQGDYMYVVESGLLDVMVNGKKVFEYERGGSFGELALLYGAPRAASIRASSDAVVWSLDRVTFRRVQANGAAKSKQKVTDSLTHVKLLEELTDEQIDAVADAVQVVHYEAGKRIIQKNEVGNVFYMIQEGEVDCTDVRQEGSNFKDLVLKAGEYFGERALLTDQLRAANVTAKVDVTLLALDREAFNRVLGPLRALLDANATLRVLATISILSKLSKRELKKVAARFQERVFKAGELIIKQGDPGAEFFIIKSGRADVTVETRGTETKVKTLEGGAYFGEMALLTSEPRTASIVALEECECFVLKRSDFVSTIGNLATIMKRAAKERSDELEDVMQRSACLSDVKRADLAVRGALGTLGTFGRVKLVYHADSKRTFALKTMHKSEVVKYKQVTNVLNEKNLQQCCQHPFIQRLFAAYEDQHRLELLLEFIQGGELFNVLHTSTQDGVSEASAQFYAAGICLALAHIHEKSIAYRDLKPENIMLDAKGYPKVVSFGFAKIVTRKTYTLCGTPEYLAPEIVVGRGHNMSVDWWAFGVLIYEMIAGNSPFADVN